MFPCYQQNFPCVPVFPRSLKVFLRFWCCTFPKIRHCFRVPSFIYQAPVVQRVDNAIHRINHYPVDIVVCFVNAYPLDSDLSGG